MCEYFVFIRITVIYLGKAVGPYIDAKATPRKQNANINRKINIFGQKKLSIIALSSAVFYSLVQNFLSSLLRSFAVFLEGEDNDSFDLFDWSDYLQNICFSFLTYNVAYFLWFNLKVWRKNKFRIIWYNSFAFMTNPFIFILIHHIILCLHDRQFNLTSYSVPIAKLTRMGLRCRILHKCFDRLDTSRDYYLIFQNKFLKKFALIRYLLFTLAKSTARLPFLMPKPWQGNKEKILNVITTSLNERNF